MAPAESGCQNGTPEYHLTQKGPKGGTPFGPPLTPGSHPGQTLKPLCCSSTGNAPYKHPLLAIVSKGLKRGYPRIRGARMTPPNHPFTQKGPKGGTPFDTPGIPVLTPSDHLDQPLSDPSNPPLSQTTIYPL